MNMIRKLFLSVLAVTAAVNVAQAAGGYSVKNGNQHDFYLDATGSTDCSIYITNNGAAGLELQYKQVEADFPSGWNMAGFCDNRGCYFAFPVRDSFLPLAANEQTSMKITIDPNGKSDTAVVKYAIWDEANPSQKDTLVFNIYVRWGASTGQIRVSDFTVAPNPATDFLELSAEGVSRICVFDIRGNQVLTAKPEGFVTRISLAGLASGQYVIMASNEKQYWSRRFLVNR